MEMLFVKRAICGWFILPCLAVLGCGNNSQITGKVSFNGTPVTSGEIVFNPIKGEPKSCSIQPDGSYAIDGVPPGECIVTVVQQEAGGSSGATEDDKKKLEKSADLVPATIAKPTSSLPSKYVDTATSTLKFTIKKGKNTIDIVLEP